MDKTLGRMKSLRLGVFLAMALVFASAPGAGAQDERVVLNADRVSYNDETGRASAQGRAVLNYQGMSIQAERIDYDAQTQKVEAMPLPGEQITLTGAGRVLKGDHLDYDLLSREGVLTGAKSSLPVGEGALYVYGGQIDVLPLETALDRGLIKGAPEGSAEYVAQWHDVTLTTCALDHPHYRLVSKTISFIPGRSVVAKRPKVYLGNTYLFTSPMDYVVQIQRRALKYSLSPYLQRSDSRGMGGGLNGTVAWETGSLSLGLAGADKIGLEWMAELEQQLSPEFTLTLGADSLWEEAWDEKVLHPYGYLTWYRNGWTARLRWSANEYIEDQKNSSYKYRGRLDRRPELSVLSPWFQTSHAPWDSWVSFGAYAGSYLEEMRGMDAAGIKRYGLTAHEYFERELSPRLNFFLDVEAGVMFYDQDHADQENLWVFPGLRYRIGALELGTGYERRWVWGESAMSWDLYTVRERIHQKVRFPLGKEVYVTARGSYDLEASMVDELHYGLQWVTDCMVWELRYKDDRTSGHDDRIGLSLYIRVFPNTPASLGEKRDRDPFMPPEGIPGKKRTDW